MVPRSRVACQMCKLAESKYMCPKCPIQYCSVDCYKLHQASSCVNLPSTVPASTNDTTIVSQIDSTVPSQLQEPFESPEAQKPLRPLTSLRWPYIPEESTYPDPLKRDDPKPLQLSQYEAIATSPAIRNALVNHPQLPNLLTSIDKLKGSDRENALQRALGVNVEQLKDPAGSLIPPESQDDVLVLRELAEAVESAVRSGQNGVLGLDWGE